MTCSFCNDGVIHKKRGDAEGFNLRDMTIDSVLFALNRTSQSFAQ